MHTSSGLTIFSIATSKYLEYWVDLVESYFSTHSDISDVKWLLLTDRPHEIPKNILALLGKNLSIRVIEHSPWPFPTLMRYKHILESSELISTANFAYLDADMLIVSKNFISSLLNLTSQHPLVLVRHPGFYRDAGIRKFAFYAANPRTALSDLVLYSKQGSVGTWEVTQNSSAFVPRRMRKAYVCGGMWFGTREAILSMCQQLSVAIDEDLKNGFIARFHDESHLNHFYAYNKVGLVPPIFCFDPTYPQLRKLLPIVIAVDKGAQR